MGVLSEKKVSVINWDEGELQKELKKAMKEIEINWSEEIRKFIEAKFREYKRKKALEEIDTMLAGLSKAKRRTASSYVREDRDGN